MLPYNEQVCLEVLKGCFTVLGLAVVGGVVGRTMEKYKAEQAISTDLRKRQYEALGEIITALGKAEAAYEYLHHLKATGADLSLTTNADEEFTRVHLEAHRVLRSGQRLVGKDAENAASDILNFLATCGDELRFRDDTTALPKLDNEHATKLNRLWRPLVALLPELHPIEKQRQPPAENQNPEDSSGPKPEPPA
jgi:hypothetical protein